MEAEKKNTFVATVVTANHKIKQPLTLLSLSSASIRRELGKDEISRETLFSRLEYIETAIKEITEVLDKLNSIKDPVIADYTNSVKMINVEEKED